MARINKTANIVATFMWDTGNKLTIYLGSNRNTGEAIVWQKTKFGTTRHTGRNITKLVSDMDKHIAQSELTILNVDEMRMDCLRLAAKNEGKKP